MKSKSRVILDKSISAMLSAIEIYNKPDFKYREEVFSILCLNSWELLLKSKVLQLAGNKDSALHVWEYKQLKKGIRSKKKSKKLNRAGNPMTISLFEALDIISGEYGVKISKQVRDNIISLTEIRDNSIHFINNDLKLNIKVQEYGTASLQNYLKIVEEWFGRELKEYNFYIMPIAFFRDFDSANGELLNNYGKKLLKFIDKLEIDNEQKDSDCFDLTLYLDVKLRKVKSNESGVLVQSSKDTNDPAVYLSEEEKLDKYPWDYDVLTTRLKNRYLDFKLNNEFQQHKKELIKNKKFCWERPYNPLRPKSGGKIYYSPNILKEFDKFYKKLNN